MHFGEIRCPNCEAPASETGTLCQHCYALIPHPTPWAENALKNHWWHIPIALVIVLWFGHNRFNNTQTNRELQKAMTELDEYMKERKPVSYQPPLNLSDIDPET